MKRSETTAFFLGALAALLWSSHFYLVTGSSRPAMLVFHFYILLWAAASCLLLLGLMGRLRELSVFKRRETQFIILVLTGGYGLWVLRALAASGAPGKMPSADTLFYLAPLGLGILSMLTREPPSGRQVVALLMGLAGCFVIAYGSRGAMKDLGLGPALPSLGAALCWTLFALAARPVIREEKLLPVSAVIWGMGAVCMFVTCLSTRENILQITRGELLLSMFLGVVTVALAYACWLKCIEASSYATAGALWYLAVVFGIGWYRRAGLSVSLWTLGGVVLVLVAVCASSGGRRSRNLTLSDVIRS